MPFFRESPGLGLPTGLLAGEGLVWNGTSWDRAAYLHQTTARNTNQRETIPRLGNLGQTSAPTAGVLYVMRIDLAAAAYTTVTVITGSTQGVTLANTFLALYDPVTLVRLAVSADLSAALAAITANTAGTLTLNYTVVTAGEYYLGLLVGSALTMPTLLRGAAFNSAELALAPPVAHRHNTTGLVATPDPLVLQAVPSGIIRFYARYE